MRTICKNIVFSASAVAGLSASMMSLPFDNIKTKLQKMKADSTGKNPYSGVLDCFRKVRFGKFI